jgi:hypothetical protein
MDNYSVSGSLKSVFLSMETETKKETSNKFLAQNAEVEVITSDNVSDSDNVDSLDEQNKIDTTALTVRNDKTFSQCSAAGDIYSEDELNE